VERPLFIVATWAFMAIHELRFGFRMATLPIVMDGYGPASLACQLRPGCPVATCVCNANIGEECELRTLLFSACPL
jgi:hypothetical protein